MNTRRDHVRSFLTIFMLVSLLVPAARAEPEGPLDPTQLSARIGVGTAPTKDVDYLPLSLRAGFDVPEWVPQLAGNPLRWVVEVGGTVIDNGEQDRTNYELNLNPLLFDLRLDWGQRIVPFLCGGEGILYTDVSRLNLGTKVLFSSQVGAGFHVFFTERDAITIEGRFRHISNAGIASPNSGLNQVFLTFALTRFPHREP